MTTSPNGERCEAFDPTTYERNEPEKTGILPLPPRKGVIGEIKPHNVKGINAGVEQLRKSKLRKSKGTPKLLVLLTYRTVDPTDPSRYEVLMADPGELKTVINERDEDERSKTVPKGTRRPPLLTRLTTWYKIGDNFPEECALKQIPYHSCPTLFGAQLEKKVRMEYEKFMRARYTRPQFPTLTSKSPWQTGHDILHEEFADFLAELAVQLRAA